MPSVGLPPWWAYAVYDENGDPGVGWKIYTYEAGTTTPKTTYSNYTGTSANTNPVVADARGECDIWLVNGESYKLVIKDENDVTVRTVDRVINQNTFEDLTVTDDLTVNGDIIGAMQWLCFDVTSETGTLSTGTAKRTFRLPACTILAARASLTTASSSGTPTFDVNDDGTSIFDTQKLEIDANETTSTTASDQATIANPTVADDSVITIDCDTAGTGAAGAKVYLKVKWTA